MYRANCHIRMEYSYLIIDLKRLFKSSSCTLLVEFLNTTLKSTLFYIFSHDAISRIPVRYEWYYCYYIVIFFSRLNTLINAFLYLLLAMPYAAVHDINNIQIVVKHVREQSVGLQLVGISM